MAIVLHGFGLSKWAPFTAAGAPGAGTSAASELAYGVGSGLTNRRASTLRSSLVKLPNKIDPCRGHGDAMQGGLLTSNGPTFCPGIMSFVCRWRWCVADRTGRRPMRISVLKYRRPIHISVLKKLYQLHCTGNGIFPSSFVHAGFSKSSSA